MWALSNQVPHMHPVINNVRVATYSMVFYCAGLLLLLAFRPGIGERRHQTR